VAGDDELVQQAIEHETSEIARLSELSELPSVPELPLKDLENQIAVHLAPKT
jgi:hypothetical protein